MQAAHRPVPQPNLGPVSFSSSRIIHNSVAAGGAAEWAALPLIWKSVAMFASRAVLSSCGGPDGRSGRAARILILRRPAVEARYGLARPAARCRMAGPVLSGRGGGGPPMGRGGGWRMD